MVFQSLRQSVFTTSPSLTLAIARTSSLSSRNTRTSSPSISARKHGRTIPLLNTQIFIGVVCLNSGAAKAVFAKNPTAMKSSFHIIRPPFQLLSCWRKGSHRQKTYTPPCLQKPILQSYATQDYGMPMRTESFELPMASILAPRKKHKHIQQRLKSKRAEHKLPIYLFPSNASCPSQSAKQLHQVHIPFIC